MHATGATLQKRSQSNDKSFRLDASVQTGRSDVHEIGATLKSFVVPQRRKFPIEIVSLSSFGILESQDFIVEFCFLLLTAFGESLKCTFCLSLLAPSDMHTLCVVRTKPALTDLFISLRESHKSTHACVCSLPRTYTHTPQLLLLRLP